MAGSLYFQFKDGAVDMRREVEKLWKIAPQNTRYLPIYRDVALMVTSNSPATMRSL